MPAARPPSNRPARVLTALLYIGALIGALLAVSGFVDTKRAIQRTLPAEAAARVNDQVIQRAFVERVATDVAQKRNVELNDALRQSVVDGLVDEELLVQRGIELGLTRVDRRVRSSLTRAALDGIMSAQPHDAPTDAQLQAFLSEHGEIFAPPVKLRLRQIFVRVGPATPGDAALARAQTAAARLRAGEGFATVQGQLGDLELARVPDAMLTRAKLLDYVGPTVLQAAAVLAPGGISDPVRSGDGYHVVQVLERETAGLPALERVRDQVLKEYQRRAGDAWLRNTLDRLRADADIVIDQRAVSE